MPREMTSTVYIIDPPHLLLLFHRKLNKWMPPGGHVNDDELPHLCALREAHEETGLEIELLQDEEHLWIESEHARSLPRPYQCLLEEIPAYGTCLAHQHLDWVFVGRPCGGKLNLNVAEAAGLRWFTASEIEALEAKVDIYPEVQAFAVQLLAKKNT